MPQAGQITCSCSPVRWWAGRSRVAEDTTAAPRARTAIRELPTGVSGANHGHGQLPRTPQPGRRAPVDRGWAHADRRLTRDGNRDYAGPGPASMARPASGPSVRGAGSPGSSACSAARAATSASSTSASLGSLAAKMSRHTCSRLAVIARSFAVTGGAYRKWTVVPVAVGSSRSSRASAPVRMVWCASRDR